MLTSILDLSKFVILSLVIYLVGSEFLAAYKISIRNSAIDGCARNSLYQTQFVNDQKQTITISQSQKDLYAQCLADKNVR